MREACRVVNDYWFDNLARPVMQVPKAIANHTSRKVSEHEGMRLVDVQERTFVSGPMKAEIWEMTRTDWLKKSTT